MIVKNGRTIHLIGKNISYIMIISDMGDLLHFYFGKKLSDEDYFENKREWERGGFVTNSLCLDELGQEYPSFGRRDMRMPAYKLENKYGNTISEMLLKECIIHNGEAVEIEGMPSLLRESKMPTPLKSFFTIKQ